MKTPNKTVVFAVYLCLHACDIEAYKYYHLNKWIKTPIISDARVYVFNWRLGLSVTQCMEVCNTTKACQYFNYEHRSHLCSMIRADVTSEIEVVQKLGYVCGNKSEWNQNNINGCDNCETTGRCNNNELTNKKNDVCKNSGCEAPRNADFKGNMFSTDNKIKHEQRNGDYQVPATIEQQTCSENGTWRPYFCNLTNQIGESKLYFNLEKTTWYKAKACCEIYGGHLLDIKSQDKQTLVETLLLSDIGADQHFWLGATDQDVEGVWRWSDSSEMEFSNWYSSNPNNSNGTEHCLQIVSTLRNFEWNDASCLSLVSSICEIYTLNK